MAHPTPPHSQSAGVSRPAVVLFDLDGTLVDSAPDLALAANVQRQRHGLPQLPEHAYRPLVGSGARGMIRVGWGKAPGDEGYEALRQEFMTLYAERLLVRTQVFGAMAQVLDHLDASKQPWGIVTNKAHALAERLVQGLQLAHRSAVLIGGDTTPHTKPHPAPLLEAARRLGVPAHHCVYVGDDHRDVQAGRAAGMTTAAAAWGYLGDTGPVETWGADVVLHTPAALVQWLNGTT